MNKKLAFMCVGLSLLSYFLIGCAIKPINDIYLNPVMADQKQVVGERSVTMPESGVSVRATALDTADLLNVSSDSSINPYIDLSATNEAKPLYTIFSITVKNNRSSKIYIDPALAVLIDANGTQHEAIPYDIFKLRFPDTEYYPPSYPYYWWDSYPFYNFQDYNSNKPADESNIRLTRDDDDQNRRRDREEGEDRERRKDEDRRKDRDRTYFYYGNRYDYCDDWGDCYWDWDSQRNVPRSYYRYQSSAYYKKAIAERSLFESTNLYPDGAKSGFLAFPLLTPEAGNLKLIIPISISENGQDQVIHFQFQFQKTPAMQPEKIK